MRGPVIIVRCVAVILFSLCALALRAQPGPPEWIEQIDPTKYILLARDFKPPFAYGTDAHIEASGQGIHLDDGQGHVTDQTVFFMYSVQTVKLAQPYANTARTNPPTPMRWDMNWQMTVGIYQNEDVCKAAVRAYYLSDFGPFTKEDENCLNDPRLSKGRGAAGAMGRFVRYRNLLLQIEMGQVSEVKSNRQKMDSDLYNGAHGNAQSHQQELIAQLARLWLDKVAGPDRPDLRVIPGNIFLRMWQDHPQVEREPAADQQYVNVWVDNTSSTVAATGVQVELAARLQGQAEFAPVGRPLPVQDIPPGGSRGVTFYWDLGGKNVENATLRVVASRPGQDDMDPVDNQCELQCSVYYANNATTAFRWVDDCYSFRNYNYKGREGQEMVEGLLSTIVGQLYTDPKATELVTRMLFPQTYTRLIGYLETSVNAGAGGHCYGMSATAGLYFMDPALRPGSGRTCDMSQDAASANVNLYQRAQMLPLVEAVISGDVVFDRNWSPANCLTTVRNSLKNDRRPVIIDIAGSTDVQEQVMVNGQPQMQVVKQWWFHSLLAYKLVEAPGRTSAVYVYDPNLPPKGQWATQRPSSAFSINTAGGGWALSPDMVPLYAGVSHISARAVTREVSLAEANAVIPGLRAKLAEMISWFEKAKKLMAVLRCPADALFTDAQGRRVGVLNGQQINEVPGAEIRSEGEVEVYVLPRDLQYSVSLNGTGPGKVGFDIIRSAGGVPEVTVFDNMSVGGGNSVAGTLAAGGSLQALTSASGQQTYSPTIVGRLEGDRASWKTGTQSPDTTPANPPGNQTTTVTPPVKPTLGTLVVCRSVDNGHAVGAGTAFSGLSEVFCLLTYENVPRQTATCIWTCNGAEVTRSKSTLEGGTGWLTFSVRSDAPGGLSAGAWEVTITGAHQRVLGSAAFTMTQPTTGTTPPNNTSPGQTQSVSELVVCRSVQNGQPIGAGTSFTGLSEVACLLTYQNLPRQTATCIWTCNGAEVSRSGRALEGETGWASFSVRSDAGLPGGAWEVTITGANQRLLGRKAFTVAQPATSTPPSNTSGGQTQSVGDLVVCRSVQNGAPVDPGTAFANAPEIACLLRYQGLGAQTVTCVWTRERTEVLRSQRDVQGGNGWVSFSLRSGSEASLQAGRWEVVLTGAGGTVLGRGPFAIGQ